MDTYEENLLRLNQKIRDLMTHIDTMETKNHKLQQENSVLVEDVADFRVQYAIAEEGRLQCKSVLEKEMVRNSEQHESHQLLKRRYNDLIREYVAQNQKLRTYESKDNVPRPQENRKKLPVEIIAKPSDVEKPKQIDGKTSALESRCAALEKKLRKAYTVIDDLEFELESVDLLEDTNQRLEKQIRELRTELTRRCQCGAPPTPSSLTSPASPLHGDTVYTFESLDTTPHNPKQDESKESKTTSSKKEPNVSKDTAKLVLDDADLEPIYSNYAPANSTIDTNHLVDKSTV